MLRIIVPYLWWTSITESGAPKTNKIHFRRRVPDTALPACLFWSLVTPLALEEHSLNQFWFESFLMADILLHPNISKSRSWTILEVDQHCFSCSFMLSRGTPNLIGNGTQGKPDLIIPLCCFSSQNRLPWAKEKYRVFLICGYHSLREGLCSLRKQPGRKVK